MPDPDDLSDLWRSDNPPYGTVRAVIVDGEYAIVLDDGMSNEWQIDLRAYRRAGDHWDEIFSQVDVGLPRVGHTHRGGGVADPPGGYGWTFGRERPDTRVALRFRDEMVEAIADSEGWWMCIRETTAEDLDVPWRLTDAG